MENSDDEKLARVRAFKERKLAEARQVGEKYRQETVERIIAAVYPKEPEPAYFDKHTAWGRVFEYLGFKTKTRVWGDACYERVGRETRKATEFRQDVEEALNGVPEEDAREVISRLLDNEEREIARAQQKPIEI